MTARLVRRKGRMLNTADYGARQFEDGLRHVVRRHIQFTVMANSEIKEAIDSRRALQNLYSQHPRTTPGIEQEIEEALARPTTEDDTIRDRSTGSGCCEV